MNDQAAQLNTTIRQERESVYTLLSERGRNSFFPTGGILAQGAEAASCELNATIGVALEDSMEAASLAPLREMISLPPDQAFKYASSYGIPALREQWKQMLYEKNPTLVEKATSTPVVTSALTHGISTATNLFLNSQDRLICPHYYWGNYNLVLQNGSGASLDLYDTFHEGGYNISGLREKLCAEPPGKKALILNFPNNPTGYTVTQEEAYALRDMLVEMAEAGNTLVVFIDDAYFGLVFKDGVYEESLFALLADAHENILAVKIDGPTKEDYVWGFRIGFITYGTRGGTPQLYEALESKTAGFIRGTISNASGVSQHLLLSCYRSEQYRAEKAKKFALLKERFDTVRKILETHPEYAEEFTALPYNSGYFMCVALRAGCSAETVRRHLVTKYSVGLIATGGILRVAFSSTPKDRLPDLFAALYKACKEVK
ncbi:aminotransferase class I/II-fold pyridoxal phosphate-dependent enzyme [Chitinivibrio alkaliphilus]|uniref:Aspartate aminotransferase n=1 Tax=Chitinivibrio alkaliphilus ACht1 TaxID=1313304 RepID=U7D5B0_9BACT|nr:aminotransferase class I/II-fold pyridoxal phosphate-dependent enzyme [Chitinivibrio alkaliphilus]ERP31133.1 Aspartate aminotransferase [Chitinivibrio alkaliphilus ACht1]